MKLPFIYRGWVVTKTFPSGMYTAWRSGELLLRADTIAGLKRLIREKMRKQ